METQLSGEDHRRDEAPTTTGAPADRTRDAGDLERPLLARGTRAFELPVRIGDAAWAKKIVVGDFTGDGKPDFATLHWETGDRCVVAGVAYHKGFLVVPYVNTTPPGATVASFTAMPGLEVISDDYRIHNLYPSDLAVGDVNGNGLDDLVVANAHHDRIYVYLSNGDGTFQPAIEVVPGIDDPCYVALGDFNGDGKLDLATLHLRRHDPFGNNFEWTLAMMFGNGDGTFQPPVTRAQGDWSFGGDNDDGAGYYKTATFDMLTLERSVVVGGARRDAVSLNGVMVWWDDTEIRTTANAITQFRAPFGTTRMEHYGPGKHDFAAAGGRDLRASTTQPGDTLRSAANTDALDRAFRGRDGAGITNTFTGSHVIVADFDGDGLLDVLWFSEPERRSTAAEQEMMIAYGQSDVIHPLTLAGPSPVPELDRIKFLPNPTGSWYRGHRAWRAVATDFNGDGYLDLLTLTAGGIQLHTNYGARRYQGAPPRLDQLTDTTPHMIAGKPVSWYGDTLEALYTLFDSRIPTGMIFRAVSPTGPSRYVALTPSNTDPMHVGTVVLPDIDFLPAGDYDVSITNGLIESSNSIRIAITIRPIEVTRHELRPIAKGDDYAPLELTGFFGPVDEPGARLTFVIEGTGTPPRPAASLDPIKVTESMVVLPINVRTPDGAYTITVDRGPRGQVRFNLMVPWFSPRIIEVGWTNPDLTQGRNVAARGLFGARPQAGARVVFTASNLYTPDTHTWRMVNALGKVVATAADAVTFRGSSENNGTGHCMFTLPSGLTPDKNLQLGVTTDAGRDSELTIPFTLDPSAAGPKPGPYIYVGVESLSNGVSGYCGVVGYGAPTTKYNESDPKKPPGALQRAKDEFNDGNVYHFEEVDAPTAASGPCVNRHWDWQALDRRTGMMISGATTAISKERAQVNIEDLYDLVPPIKIDRRAGDP